MKRESTERPILFSGGMVRSILEGRKTQTRRVMKPQPVDDGEYISAEDGSSGWASYGFYWKGKDICEVDSLCPYGQPGDRLWVRETWQEIEHGRLAAYKASTTEPFISQMVWRPSIFMPRWASRITLEIVSVRVERLQDIEEGDVWAEGITKPEWWENMDSWISSQTESEILFATLWDSINAKRGYGWKKNPWVWCIEFKVCENDK